MSEANIDVSEMLVDFVRREADLPAYPGACCRMADKWVVERLGLSTLTQFGRDFTTDEDVRDWLAEPGGIAVAVNRVMRKNGFSKTSQPQAGDVGLVIHKQRLCMAVCTGSGWLSRDEDGLIGVPIDAIWKAWRIE